MDQLAFAHQKPTQAKTPFMDDARVLLSGRVVACFLFFALHAAALTGLMSFGVAAMNEQFGVAATLASTAVAAYMVGSAGGMLLGGFVASRTSRPDFVAAVGMVISACVTLSVAAGAIPGAALPAALAAAGLAVGLAFLSSSRRSAGQSFCCAGRLSRRNCCAAVSAAACDISCTLCRPPAIASIWIWQAQSR